MNRSAPLECPLQPTTTVEWTIYPSGTEAFACGRPDGRMLRDGQALDIHLGGRWIAGFIEYRPHTPARFIALDDQFPCGLCAGMRIRLSAYQPEGSSW